jgi:hypothetical protein
LSPQSQTLLKSSFKPAHPDLLQRKCACDKSAGLTEVCSECQRKKLTLQRCSINRAEPDEVPAIVHEVLHSSQVPKTSSPSKVRALEEPNNQLIATETETQPLANRGKSIICPGKNSSDIDISVEFHDSHQAVRVKQEGAGNIRARIFSGLLKVPITITAKPSKLSRIEPNTLASQSLLAAWEVGPSQTLYRDFSVATYEMSRDLDDTTLNAPGPIIDISEKRIDKVPFAQDPIGLDVVENNPALQRFFISSDQPNDVMNVVNPPVPERTTGATHNDCSPPDKLTQYLRMFDATLFVLARHRTTGTICPIAHLDWQANIVVKVFNIDAEKTSPGKFEIRAVDFQPTSVDGILVTGRGKGNGRVPELTARGGNVANTIPRGEPGFIIVKPCP